MAKEQELIELLAQHVPEIASGAVRVAAVAREPGYLSKVALESQENDLDQVAVCVGTRGSRIKAIVEAMRGERVDLLRWSEDPQTLVRNAMQPADTRAVVIDSDQNRAIIFVKTDDRALAFGIRDRRRLQVASRLTRHEIVIELV